MTDIQGRFPDLLALGDIREQEEHEYEQIEYSDGTTTNKTKYTPDKAPILELESVVGVVNDEPFEFTEGVDYEIIDTDDDGRLETIDFAVGGEHPDPGTTFEISYVSRSVLIRYIESYEKEIHRVRNTIDRVIDSHYTAGAVKSAYIDNFEDEELVEYIFESGSENDATVQNQTTFRGNWALRLFNVHSTTCTRISSVNGLWTYPQRGDTIQLAVQLTDTDDEFSFDFMAQRRNGGGKRYYRLTVSAENDEITIQKNDGGVKSDTVSASVSQHLDEWLTVELQIGAIDTLSVEVETQSSQTLGSAQIIDTEYVEGGIRLEQCNSSQRSSVYVDAIDVIDRDNIELDQIGALFGELGDRRGRSDSEYATYLRSIVQSFSGRGTVEGIQFAVASALDVDPNQVNVNEDLENNQYTIDFSAPFPDYDLATLVELADLADPSGIEFASIVYNFDVEQIDASDSVATESTTVAWDTGSWDSMNWATEHNESVIRKNNEWDSNSWDDMNWATAQNNK